MLVYESCGYRLNLSPRLDFSEAEVHIGLNANPKPHIFQLYSAHLVIDESDERRGSHACESENWRQQHRHSTLCLSSGTKCPCALCSLMTGLGPAAQTLCCWVAAPDLYRHSCSPAEEGGKAGQGRVEGLSCGFVVCMGGLFPPLLCRLLRHLCKAAALSLLALQTCKKSNKPLNKYDHPYLFLYMFRFL